MSKKLPHSSVLNAVYAANLERSLRQETRENESKRLFRAMQLAPSINIYQALLRGENVPVASLCPEYVKRYGLKEAT